MRFLGIDLGDRRTGLALADTFTRIASPLTVLEIPRSQDGGRTLLHAVAREAANQLGPNDAVVIGLPLNMDESEGPAAKSVRDWGASLAPLLSGRAMHFQDERLSSVEADWDMARSGLTHAGKKQRRDALAAAAILRSFLQTIPGAAHGPETFDAES